MIVPQIPLISFILRNSLKVGTATYTAHGPKIARSLFAGISIVVYQSDSPAQAERIVGQLNKVAKKQNAN
jgi:hypothetical protein